VKVGDLVWHREDLKDNINIPGLIIYMMGDDIRVRFNDRTFDEVHVPQDLTLYPELYEDENIMGNP
jgi:hypothetical protein|tara:strand:+ start:481 stop:678 length:198 start_codon:yes stop_codon:yes gene_type:complete